MTQRKKEDEDECGSTMCEENGYRNGREVNERGLWRKTVTTGDEKHTAQLRN